MKKNIISAGAALALASGLAIAGETQWDFTNGDLDATFGTAIAQFAFDAELYAQFGTTTDFGIDGPQGVEANVMYIEPPFQLNSIAVVHDSMPNPDGAVYVNEYTLIYDIHVPEISFTDFDWFGFYNTSDTNSNDGDAFIRFPDGGIGIGGVYQGQIQPDTWHRVVLTWTYDADNDTMDFRKYIDGLLVGLQDNWSTVDGRWAMFSSNDGDTDSDAEWFWLLADENGEEAPAYVSSVYFVDRPLDDDEVLALGGPNAAGATTPGDPADPPCEGDLDGDGDVDLSDLGILLANWECGTTP
jgi:hypothetical protein